MSDMTIFIITCGEDVFNECMAAIRQQTLNCKIDIPVEVIKDVYPMSEAFNEMHRRCKTPYFVQVDADIILNDDALAILYQGIKKSFFFQYVVYGQLFEEGFGAGGAVRCWKKSFFRLFKFRDCRTVDRDLFKRARYFGLRRKNLNKAIGIHRPRHSVFSEYLKAKSDIEKWRFLKRPPQIYAFPLLEDLSQDCAANRYKLFGLLLGAVTSWEKVRHSKNIRIEKESLQNILRLLGYASLEQVDLSATDFDENKIKEVFALSYCARNERNQQEMLALIIRLFSKVQTSVAALAEEAV